MVVTRRFARAAVATFIEKNSESMSRIWF